MQVELTCKGGTVKYKTLFWYNPKKMNGLTNKRPCYFLPT